MNNKVKVLHVVGHLGKGGDTAAIDNIYQYIKKENLGFEFSFLTYSGYNEKFVKKIKEENCKVYVLENDARKMNLLKYIREFNKILKSNNFDVVHFHTAFQSAIGILLAKKCKIKKIICHAHITKIQRKTNIFGEKIIIPICRMIINVFSNKKIACSREAGNFLFGNQGFEVIHNGIDIDLSKKVEKKNVEKIKKKYNLYNKVVIGQVGRFDENKNQRFSVDVIKKINDDDYVMFFVGTGEEEEKIRSLVKRENLKNVYFTGFIKNVSEYMSVFNYLLLPSKYGEGLPMTLIEQQIINNSCMCLSSNIVTTEANIGNVEFLELDVESWVNIIKSRITGNKIDNNDLAVFDINKTAVEWLNCYK